MVLDNGFSYKNNIDEYRIEDGLLLYDSEAASETRPIIKSIYSVGESSKYIEFASIRPKSEKEVFEFVLKNGRLGIDYDNEGFERIEDYISEIHSMRHVLMLKEALDDSNYYSMLSSACFLQACANDDLSGFDSKDFDPISIDYVLEFLYPYDEEDPFPAVNTTNGTVDFCIDMNARIETCSTEKKEEIAEACLGTLISFINYQIRLIHPETSVIMNKIISAWEAPNLLSAMYMEIFLRFTQNKMTRKCENSTCPRFFEVIGNDYRKRYCSNNCAVLEAQRNKRKRDKEKRNRKMFHKE